MNGQLQDIVEYLSGGSSSWGFEKYSDVIEFICKRRDYASILEVGAGRGPLLMDLCRGLGVEYSMNDIDEHEMDLAPAGPARYVFDIGGNSLPDQRFDLVTSRSVLEHVRHVDVAVSNSTRLLRAGGLAVHFMPTLYSVPFVVNRILPEPVADFVLQVVAPRDRDAAPKFPAFYDHCKSTDRNIEKLHKVSGAEVAVVRVRVFWRELWSGHAAGVRGVG
jgi:SAM-dependent methyltransferase